MKKLTYLMLLMASPVFTFDPITDIKSNTKLTAFDGISAGTFQSFQSGNDSASQGALVSHALTYRELLTADLEYIVPLNGWEKGTALGGAGLKLDTLYAMFPFLPKTTGSEGLDKVLRASFVSYTAGWKLENGGFEHGLTVGIDF